MKILIAEDERVSLRVLKTVLGKWGYDVISVTNGNDAWEELQRDSAPKLAILDWMMPGIEGIELCRMLRQKELHSDEYTYVILLTAKGSKKNIITGMRYGADDYIIKPFDKSELHVRVRAGERIIQLQSELLSAKKELQKLSRTDSLTGILNRRAIIAQIEAEMSRASRERGPVSLALLDLDHFKNINDTYGHITGDAVLKECVARIDSITRSYDLIGRFGGEEFLVLLPGANENGAYVACEKIRNVIGNKAVQFNDTQVPVTISIGVATWDCHEKADDLIARADKALYQAKDGGRNRVEVARGRVKTLNSRPLKKSTG